MIELNPTLPNVNDQALDQALRGVLSFKSIGLSTYGPDRPISIWLDDSATPADQTTATNTANAHDPVFLSADKTDVQANGTDRATITVRAPKPGAAPVSITVTVTSQSGSVTSTDYPITLTNGVGTETITALDPATIVVTVKSPANRSTDNLTITAR